RPAGPRATVPSTARPPQEIQPPPPPARLYPLDDLLAEQPLRPEEKERERQHVGEPVLDGAPHQRTPVHLGQLLPDPNDEPARDRAGNRGESPEDQDGERLERDQRQAELHPALRPPHEARDDGDQARDR